MAYEEYECLEVHREEGVAYVTIDHPPINLFDAALIGEMDRVGQQIEEDDAINVVVLQSANEDFFVAHADVELIQDLPEQPPPKSQQLGVFHRMVDRFRTMPKATIGKVSGRARGGGSELLLSLDMRFAARGEAVLAQPEVAVGLIPGGGGTQRLTRLMGRGRALEVILGCGDFSAEEAERYGYVNRALPADELDDFVDELAARIASFPAHAIAQAKAAVAAAQRDPTAGLLEEAHLFNQTVGREETRRRMQAFLDEGGQTVEGEKNPETMTDPRSESSN